MWKSAASPTGLTEAEDFFHYTLQHKIHLNGMFEKRMKKDCWGLLLHLAI